MAENTTIKYVDYSALSYYDGKLKAYITSKDTEVLNRSKVTITKLETATEGSVATYEVFQNYTGEGESKTLVSLGKIEIPLDKFVSAGQVTDHVFAEGETAKKAIELTVTNGDKVYIDISGIAGDIKALENRIVKLEATHATEGEGEAKTFLTVAKEIENAVKALDTTTDVTIASVAEGVVTLKAGVKEEDGIIKQGTGDDIVLAKVATTGKAENVSVEAKSGEATDTQVAWELNDADVQAALEKIVKAEANDKAAIDKLNGTVDTEGSVRKMIKDNAGSADSNVTKVDKYEEIANPGTFITVAEYNALTDDQKALYQAVDKTLTINEAIKDAKDAATEGSAVTVEKQDEAEESYAATYVVKQNGEQVGVKINIPKDFLVKSAELKTVETVDVPYTGAKIGDKYIDFVVNAKDASETEEHIYLPVNDLVDVYTGKEVENGISIAVDENNEISATVSGKAIARENIDDDFEADLAAIEAAIGTTDDELYAVTDRIKAEAKDGIYKTTEVTTPTLCGQLYNGYEAIFVAGRTTDGEGIAVGDKCYQSDGTYLGTFVLDVENDKLYPSEKEASKDFYSYDKTQTIYAVENETINVKSNETKTIAEAIAALEESATDTNGAFVFKGSVAKKENLPTTAKKGDAYLVTDINTLFIKDETEFKQLAANGSFSVGNGELSHAVDVKSYIDSRIFIGTQEEVDAAKAAGTIDDTAFVVVTDADSQELVPVSESDIDALFPTA